MDRIMAPQNFPCNTNPSTWEYVTISGKRVFEVVIMLKILKLRLFYLLRLLNVIRSRQRDQNQRRVSEDRSRGQSDAIADLDNGSYPQITKGEQPPGTQKYDL